MSTIEYESYNKIESESHVRLLRFFRFVMRTKFLYGASEFFPSVVLYLVLFYWQWWRWRCGWLLFMMMMMAVVAMAVMIMVTTIIGYRLLRVKDNFNYYLIYIWLQFIRSSCSSPLLSIESFRLIFKKSNWIEHLLSQISHNSKILFSSLR